MSPPPYTVHPPPFHAVAQPEGLERLERWVGTCHREVQWQLRHRTAGLPEVPHPQHQWLTSEEVIARRLNDSRPLLEREDGMVRDDMRAGGVQPQAVTNQQGRLPPSTTADMRFHTTLAAPGLRPPSRLQGDPPWRTGTVGVPPPQQQR